MTNGRIENISVRRMMELCHEADPDELEILEEAARRSDPILAGFYGVELLCIVGFVPRTILSDQAYVWMCSTPAVARHKLVFGRGCRRMMQAALERYSKINGHCPKEFVGWIASLGGKFGVVDNGMVEYSVERV